MDSGGNLYISDAANNWVAKETPSGGGYIQSLIGSGFKGPYSPAVDSGGNLYIADCGNNRIVIETVSGASYTQSSFGANLDCPQGVAVDSSGNVYVDDDTVRVFKETPSGGNYAQSTILSGLPVPLGLAVDANDNLYVARASANYVSKETLSGGSYTETRIGTGSLSRPYGVAVDSNGNVYVADTGNNRVVKIAMSGVNFGSLNVGTKSASLSLSFAFETAETLGSMAVLTQGASGKDFQSASGTTCAAGSYQLNSSCTVNVTFSPLAPGVRNGAVVLYDTSTPPNALATVYLTGIGGGPAIAFGPGIISTVAGNGTQCPDSTASCGDNGPATSAEFNTPEAAAVDGSGNLYIADSFNNRIRKVTPGGTITTVAGGGSGCAGQTDSVGDGCAATSAELSYPIGVAVDGAGNLYISEYYGDRIRKVTPGGTITTVAGSGSGCAGQTDSVGDGCAATSAIISPEEVTVDGNGNLYIADLTQRVRKVTPSGIITTVAGNGTQGYTGDNAAATSAELNNPESIAIDANGNLYIATVGDNRVRKVTPGGIITTVAGNGTAGRAGDTGPATIAELNAPQHLALDAAGNLYIGDENNAAIRMVTPGGVITTILTGVGPGLALDGAGNIYIADEYANLVRKVDVADAPSLTFAGTNVGSASLAQNVAIENLGNAQLNISRISVPSGFTLQGPETSCALSGQSLSAVASCILGIEFAPQTEGLISGSITLTDNALNVSNAQQQIGLSGGQALSITTNTALIWPGSAYCGPISCYPVYGQYVPLTATITWPPSDGPAPTGTVTFYDGTTKLGTAKLTITSGSAQANLTLQPNQLSLGSNSLQATYSGDSNYLGSSGTLSLTETIYSNAVNVLTTNYGSAIGGAAATLVGTPFVGSPGSLVAQVVDAYGNPLQGYTVTFMAPTGGPSATLSSSTAISDSNGLAYVNATANTIAGVYQVTASVSGGSTFFSLANLSWYSGSSGTNTAQNLGTVAVGSSGSTNLVFLSQTQCVGLPGPQGQQQNPTTQFGIEFTASAFSDFLPWPPLNPGTQWLCSIPVNFQPLYPGLRTDALLIPGQQTVLLSGIGQGPMLDFNPGIQTTLVSGTPTVVDTYAKGVAIDSVGNVYTTDCGNHVVVKVPAGGGAQTTIGSGLACPQGVAVDGAGNVYIADPGNNQVVEVLAQYNWLAQSIIGSGSDGLSAPAGVAVDGAGNVYIADQGNGRVVEVPAAGGNWTTVGTGLSYPAGVAVDSAANVYIADYGNNRVVKEPAGGGTQITISSGLNYPAGVAVDAAGNVYIANSGINGNNAGTIVKVPVGGGTPTMVGSGLNYPLGVAVDDPAIFISLTPGTAVSSNWTEWMRRR